MSDLADRIARALDGIQPPMIDEPNAYKRAVAREAVKMATKECAKVAEEAAGGDWPSASCDYIRGSRDNARYIAAAIRALTGGKEG